MKRIIIFPYHPDVEILLTFQSELSSTKIIGIHSFLEDKIITDGINDRLGTANQFDRMLAQCDTLLILDNYRGYNETLYYEVIRRGIEGGKNVLLTARALEQLTMDEFDGKYQILKNNEIKGRELSVVKKRLIIEDIPIIAVSGMGKNCSKFELQIILKKELEKQGYCTAWISSNELGVLFGSYTFPDMLFGDCVSFENKVFAVNHFVYGIAMADKHDVIIVGIPEGITEFDTNEYHHFGEYPLVIGSALSVDSSILCTYYMNEPNEQGITSMCEFCNHKYALPVHAIAIGKTNFENEDGSGRISYSFLEDEYLRKHFVSEQRTKIPFICPWDLETAEQGIRYMVKRLQNNAEAI